MADKINGHWYTDKNGNHYFVENGQTPKEGWEASKRRKMISGGTYKISEDGENYEDVDEKKYRDFEADETSFDETNDDDFGFDEDYEEDNIDADEDSRKYLDISNQLELESVIDELGYSDAVEFGDGLNRGKIFADETTLKQIQKALSDEGYDTDIKGNDDFTGETPRDSKYKLGDEVTWQGKKGVIKNISKDDEGNLLTIDFDGDVKKISDFALDKKNDSNLKIVRTESGRFAVLDKDNGVYKSNEFGDIQSAQNALEDLKSKSSTNNDSELDNRYNKGISIIEKEGFKNNGLSSTHRLLLSYAKGEIDENELVDGFREKQKPDVNEHKVGEQVTAYGDGGWAGTIKGIDKTGRYQVEDEDGNIYLLDDADLRKPSNDITEQYEKMNNDPQMQWLRNNIDGSIKYDKDMSYEEYKNKIENDPGLTDNAKMYAKEYSKKYFDENGKYKIDEKTANTDKEKYLAPEEIGIDYDHPEESIRYYEKKNNVKLYEQPNGSFKVVPNKVYSYDERIKNSRQKYLERTKDKPFGESLDKERRSKAEQIAKENGWYNPNHFIYSDGVSAYEEGEFNDDDLKNYFTEKYGKRNTDNENSNYQKANEYIRRYDSGDYDLNTTMEELLKVFPDARSALTWLLTQKKGK